MRCRSDIISPNVCTLACFSMQSSQSCRCCASRTMHCGADTSPELPCFAMQHPDIYGVLLELADHCDVPDVRANAVQLLNYLPTHSQVLDSIRAALQGPQPAQDLENLLSPSQIAPTRLLYTLQVCTHKNRRKLLQTSRARRAAAGLHQRSADLFQSNHKLQLWHTHFRH